MNMPLWDRNVSVNYVFLSYFFLLFRLSVCVVTFRSSNGKRKEILFHIVDVTKIFKSIGSIIAVCICSSLFILLLNNSLLSNTFFYHLRPSNCLSL